MKIAVIGAGNVGGTLAKSFAKVGHQVFLGVRNLEDSKVKALVGGKISAYPIYDAAARAKVIVMAAYPQATQEISKQLGNVSGKIIIDVMNVFRGMPEPYITTTEALLAWTNTKDVVRCFNTTGWENMANPKYGKIKIDMFVVGNSKKGKRTASKLAKEIGFGKVYDLGGDDKFELMEQIVIAWVGLARVLGRNMALQILRR